MSNSALRQLPETRRDLLRNDFGTTRYDTRSTCAPCTQIRCGPPPLRHSWPVPAHRILRGYLLEVYQPSHQGTFSILLTYMTRPTHPTPRRPRRGGSGFRVGASPRPPTDPPMWPGPASQPCLVVSSWRARRGRRRGFRPCAPDAYHLAARWVCGVAKACWRGEAHSTDQHGCSERTWVVSCFGVTVVKLLPV